jgi:hypothetical protein
LSTKPNYEVKDGKLIIHHLQIPWIGRSITDRSSTQIHLPVIQVSKNGFADADETPLPSNMIPDQFQLSSGSAIALTSAKMAQTFTNRSGNIGSFIVSPAPNTGAPQDAITVKLCPLTIVGMPDEANAIATQTIGPHVWDAHIGNLLAVELHTELKPQGIYALVLSSAGDADNHRNLSASATDKSALTASYGPGRIVHYTEPGWVEADNNKQSLFFVTLAD